MQAERAERKLRFVGGCELAEELSVETRWFAKPYLAPGVLTELDGKVKKGKTTWLSFLLESIFTGKRFLGEATVHANAVYLTEQHRDYVEFPKVKVVEQREYFKWRHGHPDSVIVKTERTEEKEK